MLYLKYIVNNYFIFWRFFCIYLLLIVIYIVIRERNRIRRFCCWEIESDVYLLYFVFFLIIIGLFGWEVGEILEVGGIEWLIGFGEIGGVRLRRIFNFEFLIVIVLECFFRFLLLSWRVLFWKYGLLLKMMFLYFDIVCILNI